MAKRRPKKKFFQENKSLIGLIEINIFKIAHIIKLIQINNLYIPGRIILHLGLLTFVALF